MTIYLFFSNTHIDFMSTHITKNEQKVCAYYEKKIRHTFYANIMKIKYTDHGHITKNRQKQMLITKNKKTRTLVNTKNFFKRKHRLLHVPLSMVLVHL